MTASYKSILASYKKGSKSRFDSKKNYSSFWMDDDQDWYSRSSDRFSGLGSGTQKSNDTVKAIKLNNYQRAIANFVSILTGKAIPVTFHGDTSYTDGKSVTISTDIKDDNFDVSVGLALHEASHIVLTNFEFLKNVASETGTTHVKFFSLWKNLLNWVEDRRIDNYIFKTSPGYRAYYHKMYDYYWNDKAVTKGLQSADMRDPKDVESYLFRIINSLNPASDPTALPGLQEILDTIDVKNIARLKSVEESGEVADKVLEILMKHVENPQSVKSNPTAGEGEGEPAELTPAEEKALQEAIKKQKEFLDGNAPKKSGTKALTRKLKQVKASGVEMQMVGGGESGNMEQACLIYDMTGDDRVARAARVSEQVNAIYLKPTSEFPSYRGKYKALEDAKKQLFSMVNGGELPDQFSTSVNDDYTNAIQSGLDMGGLLGKKLQLRDESRELVHNRLRSGHIDNRRLAQAGFGMETVFKQTLVSKHKKANLHITLDGSGSMRGVRWTNTVQMCTAIAKAATYVHNLDIQVSIRITGTGDVPCVVYVYDSRKNPLRQLTDTFRTFVPNGFTPEGLCLEALQLSKLFIPGTREQDSYLLNISDGEPGGVKGYDNRTGVGHTKKIVKQLEQKLQMGIISFFMHNYGNGRAVLTDTGAGKAFVEMYGMRNSHDVDASDAIGIAKAMNKKFLEMA